MNRLSLAAARLCSALWVGAAFLFVVTSVTEQIEPSFDADTKDTLALIRFPWYYGTAFPLLIAGTAAAALAGLRRTNLASAAAIAAALLFLAQTLLWLDYAAVYQPLRDRLLAPGPDRGPEFDRLHAWSERLNATSFLLSAAAALLLQAARPKP